MGRLALRTRILLPVLLLVAAMIVVMPSAASASVKTETVTRGAVKAVLTYDVGPGVFNVSGTHLAIMRSGVTALDTDVPEPCNGCGIMPAGSTGGTAKSLQVADLDGDGEPEVLLDIYTGGAHCCVDTWIYRFNGSSYTGTPAEWGDVGYTLKDLDGDGVPELRSADDRFAYAFTSYAESWFPPRVWQFRAGRLSDVTRRYPSLAKADAKRILRIYHGKNRRKLDLRGAVAAYVADQYLLGHGSRGWKLVRSAHRQGLLNGLGRGDPWARGARFDRVLRKFLRHNGYTR
jgi:hypothetical protein